VNFNEARDDWVTAASDKPHANHMHLAYLAPNRKTCQQLHHLFFVTDQMLFLMQNSVKALKASEHYKQLLSLSCSDYTCK